MSVCVCRMPPASRESSARMQTYDDGATALACETMTTTATAAAAVAFQRAITRCLSLTQTHTQAGRHAISLSVCVSECGMRDAITRSLPVCVGVG